MEINKCLVNNIKAKPVELKELDEATVNRSIAEGLYSVTNARKT